LHIAQTAYTVSDARAAADCDSASRNRTRSTFRIASRKRASLSEIRRCSITEMGTLVKENVTALARTNL
jgi:hypothetical protein